MKTPSLVAACVVTFASIPSAFAEAPSDARAASRASASESAALDAKPDAEAKSAGARNHDGFYMRFAMGLGAYSESFQSRDTPRYGGESGGDASGFATVGELAIGGTAAPGLVLGGGIYTASMVTGSFSPDEGVTVPDELDPERRDFQVVGPFIDWYPNPSKGLHLQAAIGFASIQSGWGSERSEPEYAAYGGGVMLGVGYEWFVADEWSLGVMGRITGAVVTGEDDNGVRFYHAVGTSPSLLLAVTYH